MLRQLKEKDAQRMLEWMHNPSIIKYLSPKFINKNLDDCIRFIKNSLNDSENIHLAVTDLNDLYMGTISLKNINREKKYAEFAITMHPEGQGTGLARTSMENMLEYAWENQHLNTVYWCVDNRNSRALKFYIRGGYQDEINVPNELLSLYDYNKDLIWFASRNKNY